MGVIELDPLKLLEEGLRRKLASKVAAACDPLLHFSLEGPSLSTSLDPSARIEVHCNSYCIVLRSWPQG